MAILQISALTVHISFLLWELIILQTRSWQIYLPSNGDFTDSCSDSSLLWEFIIWQTRSWQIYPPIKWPILQIPALTAHYSKISKFGRPGLGRYDPPHQMAISQIAALTAHISFLLWKLHIWQTKVLADLTPLINGNFTDSCSTLRDHIWQAKFWQIYPHIKWQFHRFLWNSYFIPTLRAQHLADQVLADLPPIKYWFHRWLFIGSHAAPADHLALHLQISPLNGNFTDSCSDSSYFIPTLRAQHLADQVLTGLPPIQWWFYRFLFWQLTTLRAYHSTDHV